MTWLRQVVLFVHLSAAMFWIGEMVFIAVVIAPYGRTLSDPEARVALYRETGRRTLKLVWLAIGTLVVTGFGNLALMGVGPAMLAQARFWLTPFGLILAVKLVAVATMIVLAALHDFVYSHRGRELRQHLATAPAAERPAWAVRYRRHQRRLFLIGRANLIIGLAVLFLAAGLAVWH